MNVNNYCTGGKMLNSSVALVGSEAERFVRGIHADSFFFSARGFCDGRISDSSKDERDIKIAMLKNSEKHYFLCDASKQWRAYPYIVADKEQTDVKLRARNGMEILRFDKKSGEWQPLANTAVALTVPAGDAVLLKFQ